MKIQSKLFVTFFGFSIILITILVLLMQWSIGNGMIEYVNTKDLVALKPVEKILAQEYKKNNSWSAFNKKNEQFLHLILQQLDENDPQLRPPSPPSHQKDDFRQRPPKPEGELQRSPHLKKRKPPSEHGAFYALLDEQKALVAERYDEPKNFNHSPVIIDNLTVGYLAVSKRSSLTQGYELDFIEKQQAYLWIIALITLVLVLLLTLLLTRHIVVPVKLIAKGIHQLTQGNFQQSVILNRKDELGDLNRDCNELAFRLSKNEHVRKRWLADTSHELRTPVAILSGELEAMYHGIRPLNKENIASAMDEVKHLSRLINDLHQLNNADIGGMDYCKSSTNLVALLTNEQDKYQTYLTSKNITLDMVLTNDELMVYLDETRFFS